MAAGMKEDEKKEDERKEQLRVDARGHKHALFAAGAMHLYSADVCVVGVA
jgi:hypothetical protein